MPSLTQLLTSHDRLLVLDAASRIVQVGLLRAGFPEAWSKSEEEAGSAIFTGTESLIDEAGLRMSDIGAFVFCEGPGSMLGIRTSAMAVRTWQLLTPLPAYAYQSLAVSARYAWTKSPPRDFAVIADARRNTWHCQSIATNGRMPPLQRVPDSALPAGELVTPGNFRAWATPSRPVGICSYDLALIFPVIAGKDFFREIESPDAFQHDAPEYKKWSAQIHSTLTADKK
jgi:tRNA threonylcarbamoyladenosine biosynthesis protein TsaB